MSNSLDRPSNSPSWMVAYITHNLPEAHIIAGRLQSEGIGAWVHQEPFGSALGITVGSLGEVRVLVDEADYEHALAILESEPPALPDDVDQMIFEDDPDDDDE